MALGDSSRPDATRVASKAYIQDPERSSQHCTQQIFMQLSKAFPTSSVCKYAMEGCGNSGEYVALHACLDLSWFYLFAFSEDEGPSGWNRPLLAGVVVSGTGSDRTIHEETHASHASQRTILSHSTPILLYYPTAYLRPVQPPFYRSQFLRISFTYRSELWASPRAG